jgi:hypothetical protein
MVAVAADQGQWWRLRVDRAEVVAEQQQQQRGSWADRAEVVAEQQQQRSSRVERSH